jgi:SAM-dependent methyltransferase
MGRALDYPATRSNRDPLLAVLQRVLPEQGLLLEIASGSGQHAVFMAPQLPGITWQPSDPQADAVESIAAWRAKHPSANLLPPVSLDVTQPWPVESAAAVLCVNMIHISPWAATLGLFQGAGQVLEPDGVLVTYGPYQVGGVHTAPSNAAFDGSLRARNPAWGVRDIRDLQDAAAPHGLILGEQIPMPANNMTLVWTRG